MLVSSFGGCDIVGEAIQFPGNATQGLFDVWLDSYIRQSPRMTGLLMIVS